MEIPCKECLVFACCKGRMMHGDGYAVAIHDLTRCEIFKEWYDDKFYSHEMYHMIHDCFKVKYIYGR